MGELDQARAFLERTLELCESLQWPLRTAQTLRSLGDLAAATGDADAAQAAWRTAHDLFLQCCGPEMAEETRALLDGGDLGDAALGAREGAGFQMGQPARAGGAGLPAGSRPGSCEPDGPGGRFGNSHPGPDIYTV